MEDRTVKDLLTKLTEQYFNCGTGRYSPITKTIQQLEAYYRKKFESMIPNKKDKK